jgi:hypothetical protein
MESPLHRYVIPSNIKPCKVEHASKETYGTKFVPILFCLFIPPFHSFAIRQGHKLITPLPFFHIYGMLVSLLYCGWKVSRPQR